MKLLKETDVSKELGIPVGTLRRWRLNGGTGRGPHYLRVGRSVRYLEKDIVEWLTSCRVGAYETRAMDGPRNSACAARLSLDIAELD